MKKYTFLIIILVILTIFNFTLNFMGLRAGDVLSQPLPEKDKIAVNYLSTFFVSKKSYFEKQGKSQCGGYSSAYVLRCLDRNVIGKTNYKKLKHKFVNGYVMPVGITDVFSENGIKAMLYKGNTDTIKTRLSKYDIPIIVLIGNKWHWQHYVTVVGYDRNSIYLYDSNKETDNSNGYNRVMTTEEFESNFNNRIPIFNHIYFVSDKETKL